MVWLLERADVADAVGGYDIRSGEITISVMPGASLGAGARELLQDRLTSDVRALRGAANPATTLSVQVVDRIDAGVDASNMRGGGYLQVGTNRHCTAGFTVRRISDGVRGVSTARHCADHWTSLRYYNHGTSAFTDIARRARAGTSWGDLAWYSRGSYTPIPWVYSNYSTTRAVDRVLRPTTGQSLCKFGRTTGYTCDEVYRLNECSSGYCGLVAPHRRNADGGDSGGPWFWGNTAYGIHHGSKTIWFIRRDLFSQAANLPDALGVRVLVR